MTPQEFFKKDLFAEQTGVELLEVREGYSKARLVITENHLNAGHRTQGGAIFTLADLALAAITECVKTGKGNLLELAVEAARVRATLGEISYACEQIVGRYKAIIRTISGVYSSESKGDADFKRACELTEKFAKKEGRQPRIMVAKMGQDGHDRGAKVVATGYAEIGRAHV